MMGAEQVVLETGGCDTGKQKHKINKNRVNHHLEEVLTYDNETGYAHSIDLAMLYIFKHNLARLYD